MFQHDQTLFINRERVLRGFSRLLETPSKSVMGVHAPQHMGKTWLMYKMQFHCQQDDVGIPVARVEFRDPRDMDRIVDHLGWVRLLRDRFEMPHFFGPLNELINALTSAAGSASGVGPSHASALNPLAVLAEQIGEAYNMNELERSATHWDLQFENIGGDTIFQKAYGVVTYFHRRGNADVLQERLMEERDHIDWQEFFDKLPPHGVGISAPQILSAPRMNGRDVNGQGGNHVADLELLLPPIANEVERKHIERRISDAFFACVETMVEQKGQVLLLIDSYEEIPQVAEQFLTEQLLPRLKEPAFEQLHVIVAGRTIPDFSDTGASDRAVTTHLTKFTEQYVIEFMRSRNVPEDSSKWTPESALTFSGGKPGVLALIADEALAILEDQDDDFFN